VELTHSFTVPASLDETWRALQDIEGVAGCFPGASIGSVEGDTFHGSCKVKLGPIALVYNGSGTFVSRDESTHTLHIEARGKDKRGNGTAGADVTATLSAVDDATTTVSVVTDLAVTGKPAQFGRGVMQDVSDKLLGQFVDCLEGRVGAPEAAEGEAPAVAAGAPVESVDGTSVAAAADAAAAGEIGVTVGPGPVRAPRPAATPGASVPPSSSSDDALDLGAAVLPVLVRTYGKQLAAGLVVLIALWWLLRRLRG